MYLVVNHRVGVYLFRLPLFVAGLVEALCEFGFRQPVDDAVLVGPFVDASMAFARLAVPRLSMILKHVVDNTDAI